MTLSPAPDIPWIERPTLEVDMTDPRRWRRDDFPAEAIEAGQTLLHAVLEQIPKKARLLAYWVCLRTRGRFHREIHEVSRLIDADWRDVVTANIAYDLVLSSLGCSTIALPTPAGPVVARNMDWWPEDLLAKASYLLSCTHKGQKVFSVAGWPGGIGVVTGLSERGFAVVLNAVLGPDKRRRTGYPVLFHLRRVLEDAKDFHDAVNRLSRQKLTTSALFTVVGTENDQRVVVERTPTQHVLRWAEKDKPLIATNDYRTMFQPQTDDRSVIYQTTCSRYEALCRFFGHHTPDRDVTDASLLYILTDPSVMQSITAQHIIVRPRPRQMRVFVPRR